MFNRKKEKERIDKLAWELDQLRFKLITLGQSFENVKVTKRNSDDILIGRVEESLINRIRENGEYQNSRIDGLRSMYDKHFNLLNKQFAELFDYLGIELVNEPAKTVFRKKSKKE